MASNSNWAQNADSKEFEDNIKALLKKSQYYDPETENYKIGDHGSQSWDAVKQLQALSGIKNPDSDLRTETLDAEIYAHQNGKQDIEETKKRALKLYYAATTEEQKAMEQWARDERERFSKAADVPAQPKPPEWKLELAKQTGRLNWVGNAQPPQSPPIKPEIEFKPKTEETRKPYHPVIEPPDLPKAISKPGPGPITETKPRPEPEPKQPEPPSTVDWTVITDPKPEPEPAHKHKDKPLHKHAQDPKNPPLSKDKHEPKPVELPKAIPKPGPGPITETKPGPKPEPAPKQPEPPTTIDWPVKPDPEPVHKDKPLHKHNPYPKNPPLSKDKHEPKPVEIPKAISKPGSNPENKTKPGPESEPKPVTKPEPKPMLRDDFIGFTAILPGAIPDPDVRGHDDAEKRHHAPSLVKPDGNGFIGTTANSWNRHLRQGGEESRGFPDGTEKPRSLYIREQLAPGSKELDWKFATNASEVYIYASVLQNQTNLPVNIPRPDGSKADVVLWLTESERKRMKEGDIKIDGDVTTITLDGHTATFHNPVAVLVSSNVVETGYLEEACTYRQKSAKDMADELHNEAKNKTSTGVSPLVNSNPPAPSIPNKVSHADTATPAKKPAAGGAIGDGYVDLVDGRHNLVIFQKNGKFELKDTTNGQTYTHRADFHINKIEYDIGGGKKVIGENMDAEFREGDLRAEGFKIVDSIVARTTQTPQDQGGTTASLPYNPPGGKNNTMGLS